MSKFLKLTSRREEAIVHHNPEALRGELRICFYCLEGYVFLGSLSHDGEEIVEAIRCRKSGGTGVLPA